MAIAFDHFEVTIEFIDTGKDKTSRTFDTAASVATYADALTAAAAMATAYAAASLCAVTGYSVRGVYVEGALTLPTSAGARVSMEALITGSIEGNPLKSANFTIPGPVADVFVSPTGPNSDVVDAASTEMLAVAANLLNGADLTISDGEQFDSSAPNFQGIRRTKFRRLA